MHVSRLFWTREDCGFINNYTFTLADLYWSEKLATWSSQVSLLIMDKKLLLQTNPKCNTHWFSVWPSRRRYPLPFLSLSNGPACNKTVLHVMCSKSSCFVMQLICSILPSNDICWVTGPISRQHLYSRALDNVPTAHSPQVHLQNQNKRFQKRKLIRKFEQKSVDFRQFF